jgi:AraC-like DNA-binding protein
MTFTPEQTLDLLLRGASLGLLTLLVLRLLQPPRNANRLICLSLLLCIGGYLLISGHYATQIPMAIRLPLIILATLVPALFWLFGQALFNDELRWHWSHALPALLLAVAPLLFKSNLLDSTSRHWLDVLQHLFGGALIAHVLWLIWRHQGADLLLARRRLRLWLGPGIGLYILSVLMVELIFPLGGVPGWLDTLNMLGIGLVTLWFSLRLETLLDLLVPSQTNTNETAPEPTTASEGEANEPSEEADPSALLRLQHAMHAEQLWRRESLSVTDLAKHLGLAEYRLRRLINGALGQRNFNSYLNQFRIVAACKQLADPSKRRLPILSIALDVGFASIGPFNRAFKAQLALTPSEYRRQYLGES